MTPTKTPRCPQCGEASDRKARCFPFCSDRCQMLDLGAWATEKYRVAAVETEADSESNLSDQEKNSGEHEH